MKIKTKITLKPYQARQMKLIKTNCIDSFFCIENGIDPENYMLVNWGNIKLNVVDT